MGKTNRLSMYLLIFLAVAGFLLSHGKPALASTTMPEFSLEAAGNNNKIRSEDFKGKVLLVNFWATWCPPCRKEIPTLIELQTKYKSQKFSVIGISVDISAAQFVKDFAKKMKINYPVALGSTNLLHSFGGGTGIPATFLVDQDGNIVKTYPGYVSKKQFQSDIGKLLK